MVKPKKYLGQHFLKDNNIARKIVESLSFHHHYRYILEIGPGMGILTQYLLEKFPDKLFVIEIDKESVNYLRDNFLLNNHLLEGDVLNIDFKKEFGEPLGIIGNFPYNISSQIFFKILDNISMVQEVVGMLQREVAERLHASHGSKKYGILSVLLQNYYHLEYLFDVGPQVFKPPPKVESAVIRLKKRSQFAFEGDYAVLKRLVKTGFQNRRKKLRNALKALNLPDEIQCDPVLDNRAEQLSVEEFSILAKKIEILWKNS